MAFFREYRLKLEVTLNGSGFDLPSGGSIRKTLEMPTATLRYPNKFGSLFQRFSPRDVFRIYVGRDEVPDEPTFVGYPTENDGEVESTISLISRLHACETEYVYIDEYDNYDGWEVSKVIEEQLLDSDIHAAPAQFGMLQGTNPAVFIPQGYRQDKGISRYQLMKFARDLAYDISVTTGEALTYHLSEQGNGNWLFTKQKPLIDGYEWWSFNYSANLLSTRPKVNALDIVNRQTCFTPAGEKVTFNLAHDQQLNIKGIHEGVPISMDYGGVEEAYNRARFECLSKRAPSVNTSITHMDLIEAVPGISIVRITGAPNLIDGLHRVVGVGIDFSGGLKIVCDLEKSPPILSKEIIAMLTASR